MLDKISDTETLFCKAKGRLKFVREWGRVKDSSSLGTKICKEFKSKEEADRRGITIHKLGKRRSNFYQNFQIIVVG